MNPGVVEETGKVAVGIIDALKSTPMSIAMILTNASLIVFLFYSQNQFYNQRQELSKLWIEETSRTMTLLSKCIVPERRGELPPLEPRPPKPADTDGATHDQK
jgi:hypothetical protein